MRPTPFMGLRDIVGALVLIALGDAANKAPLSRLLWASLQDFRGLAASIPIFWAWVIPGGGVNLSASQFLRVPSVVANRIIWLESSVLKNRLMPCMDNFLWVLIDGVMGIGAGRDFVMCLVIISSGLGLFWFFKVVRGPRSCRILLFVVVLL